MVPLWQFVNEFMESLFELDLRALHTIPQFLFLPGRLTNEYIRGRRRRYVRPFRLYLFASFFLFGVLALTTFDLSAVTGVASTAETNAEAAERLGEMNVPLGELAVVDDSLRGATLASMRQRLEARGLDSAAVQAAERALQETLRQSPRASDSRAPSARPSLPAASSSVDPPSPAQAGLALPSLGPRDELSRYVADSLNLNVSIGDATTNSRVEQLLRSKVARTIQEPRELVGIMIDKGPYLMFVLLPVFALLLKLLYVRQGRFYAEHIIFTLHMHALSFIAFAGATLLHTADSAWLNEAGTWMAVSPFLYVVLAMRHVYGQGLLKTLLKATTLLLLYSIILTVGLVLLAVAALALM
jgi:hypothetical protein